MSNGNTIVKLEFFILYIDKLNEYLCTYENHNLRTYADTKYENFLLFKHPKKGDIKESLKALVKPQN